MPGGMDIKAKFEVLEWNHDDPKIQAYLEENLQEIIEVWWDNLGLPGLTNYINRIIKAKQKGGKKNA